MAHLKKKKKLVIVYFDARWLTVCAETSNHWYKRKQKAYVDRRKANYCNPVIELEAHNIHSKHNCLILKEISFFLGGGELNSCFLRTLVDFL